MPGRVNILSSLCLGAEAAALLDANNSRALGAAVTAADKLPFPRTWR